MFNNDINIYFNYIIYVLREYIKRDIRLSEDVLKKLEGKTGLSADEKRSEQKKKIFIAERAIERYR